MLFISCALLLCLLEARAEDVNNIVNMKLLTKIRETRSLAASDIVIVLDESTSITTEAFETAKKSCEMILEYYDKPDTRFSVIFFATSSRIISPWSSNRVEVATTIREAYQQGGTTEMGSALTKARDLFQLTEERNSRTKRPRIVFLITDGYPSSDPTAVAQSLKWDSKATLFVIGVGNEIDLKTVESIASPSYGFKVDSFEQFMKDLAAAQRALLSGADQPESKIVFTVKMKDDKVLGTRDNIPILMDIRNYLSRSIPANSAIVFRADGYLVPMRHIIRKEIPSMDRQTLEFELHPSAESSLQTLPEFITVNIVDNHGLDLPVEYDRIRLPLEYFVGDLVRMKPADRRVRAFNTLVFGVIGAGKSSWINSIVTALSHQVENQLASVGGTSGHVTTQLVRYRLYNIPDVPEVPLNLWDSWGVTLSNYDEEFIGALLKGDVPSGFKIASTYSPRDNTVNNATDYPLSREMHAVVIVVPQAITEDSDMLQKMQKVVQQMIEYNPVIVVTHMDEVSEEAHHRVQSQIAKEFRVPENRIHLLTNYVTDREKNFARDKANIVLLNEIMQSANARLKRHLATSEDFENYVEQESEMDLVFAILVSLIAVAVVVLFPLYPFSNNNAPAPRNNPQPRPRRSSSSRPRRSNSRPESVQESPQNSSSNISQIHATKKEAPAEEEPQAEVKNENEEQDPNDNNTPILDRSVNDNNSDNHQTFTPTPEPDSQIDEEEETPQEEEETQEVQKKETPTSSVENDNDPNADNLQASLGSSTQEEQVETPQAEEEEFVLMDQN